MNARSRRRHGKKTRLRRFVVAVGGLAFVTWLVGLAAFASMVPRTPQTDDGVTDAIVVLTGGSSRMEQGLALLTQGKAKKLFVSGVHRDVALEEILRRVGVPPDQAPCCIVLGYRAGHTEGNARETANWIRKEQYGSLRLVTANYHMPRSLLEFGGAMPGISIIPHPVFPESVKIREWWRWPGTATLILGEYNKYLVVAARLAIRKLSNPGGSR
jgi:uncharacterized SAM-binding protein YcdF (DUF218 family)